VTDPFGGHLVKESAKPAVRFDAPAETPKSSPYRRSHRRGDHMRMLPNSMYVSFECRDSARSSDQL
jgi:hypothetical protein